MEKHQSKTLDGLLWKGTEEMNVDAKIADMRKIYELEDGYNQIVFDEESSDFLWSRLLSWMIKFPKYRKMRVNDKSLKSLTSLTQK